MGWGDVDKRKVTAIDELDCNSPHSLPYKLGKFMSSA